MSRFVCGAFYAAAMITLNDPLDAQDAISIPLQGNLPVRCSAHAANISIDEAQVPPAVVVTVDHSCNARSNLIISFSEISGLVASGIDATYGGQPASASSAQQISFLTAGPVSGTRQLRLSLPGGSTAEAQLLAQALQLSVEAP